MARKPASAAARSPAPLRRRARKPAAAPKAAPAPEKIGIRMYRLGVGDCFLLSLPRPGGKPFRMLIDCGIHAAETGGKDRIRRAVQDIRAETGDHIDLVVGTHLHWDHLSGFFHARDLFQDLKADAIWCAWTEDQTDAFARALAKHRDEAVNALWGAMGRKALAETGSGKAPGWEGILGFFGDRPGTGPKAKQAADAMRALVASEEDIHYHTPGEEPFDAVSDSWRIFVLGPPRNRDQLEKLDPSRGSGEAYPLAAAAMGAANLSAAVGHEDDLPFKEGASIELGDTRNLPFFRERYWCDGTASGKYPQEEVRHDWRQIAEDWLDVAGPLALTIDRMTNNTSLVLALEIGPRDGKDNRVILFAADAQIGNWSSWKDVEWKDYAGRQVTGPDLLRRTVIYKVGHHASHNATLMEGGLEIMNRLALALVPTSSEMAGKVGWGTLPWLSLLRRLQDRTGDCLLRSDLGATAPALAGKTAALAAAGVQAVRENDLCFEIEIAV